MVYDNSNIIYSKQCETCGEYVSNQYLNSTWFVLFHYCYNWKWSLTSYALTYRMLV